MPIMHTHHRTLLRRYECMDPFLSKPNIDLSPNLFIFPPQSNTRGKTQTPRICFIIWHGGNYFDWLERLSLEDVLISMRCAVKSSFCEYQKQNYRDKLKDFNSVNSYCHLYRTIIAITEAVIICEERFWFGLTWTERDLDLFVNQFLT